MPATYTEITYGEMRELLKAERGWVELKNNIESTKEYVFTRDLETLPGVQIKVYSSIPRHSERARGCGQDAIRVCAIRKVGDKWQGLVKSQRVHRTQNWHDNLMARIQTVFETAKQRVSWDNK
jgi:hypothetical protein